MLVLRVGTGGEFRVSGCIRSAIRHALRQSATYSKRHKWRDSVAPRENAAPALLAEISKTASDVKERVVEMCIFHSGKRKRRYAASWWITRKSAPVSGSKNFTKSRDEKVDAWDERIARAESTLCCHTLGGKRHIFEKKQINVAYILSQTSQTIFFRLQEIKSFSKIFFEKILQKCLKNLFF